MLAMCISTMSLLPPAADPRASEPSHRHHVIHRRRYSTPPVKTHTRYIPSALNPSSARKRSELKSRSVGFYYAANNSLMDIDLSVYMHIDELPMDFTIFISQYFSMELFGQWLKAFYLHATEARCHTNHTYTHIAPASPEAKTYAIPLPLGVTLFRNTQPNMPFSWHIQDVVDMMHKKHTNNHASSIDMVTFLCENLSAIDVRLLTAIVRSHPGVDDHSQDGPPSCFVHFVNSPKLKYTKANDLTLHRSDGTIVTVHHKHAYMSGNVPKNNQFDDRCIMCTQTNFKAQIGL